MDKPGWYPRQIPQPPDRVDIPNSPAPRVKLDHARCFCSATIDSSIVFALSELLRFDGSIQVVPYHSGRAMQAQLRVVQKQANIQQVRLLRETVIGRSTDCNLKIASTQVSRRHCRIVVNDAGVFVEDLCSANGTFLDGQRLLPNQSTLAPAGSQLVVGPATFVVEYRTASISRPELGAAPPPVAVVSQTAAAEETATISLDEVTAAITSEGEKAWQPPPVEAVFANFTATVAEETSPAEPAAEPPKRMRSLFGFFSRDKKVEKSSTPAVPFLPTEPAVEETVSEEAAVADSDVPHESVSQESAEAGNEFAIGVDSGTEPAAETETDNPFRQFSQY